MKILIYGHKGWIASKLIPLLLQKNHNLYLSNARVDNLNNVEDDIKIFNPDTVLSLIGRTSGKGYNTIDYLENPDKIVENINDNLFCPVSLALICQKYNIHLTYLGTGCIFNYNDDLQNDKFNENDLPNFFGSNYSIVKGFTDRLMHLFDNVLNVRIRMPISNKTEAKNFITKITTYEKICSIDNSVTVLPSLLPLLVDMIENKKVGTINLTNPGKVSHNYILQMYNNFIDENFKWSNFTIEEQNKILLSKRSNNELDTTLLEKWYPNVESVHLALYKCFLDYNK